MLRTTVIFSVVLTCLLGCQTRNLSHDANAKDRYVPKLRITATNYFTGEPGVAYRFTDEQLAQMARTKLETNRFVMYLERRWPVERLQNFCVLTNRFPQGHQNLVAMNCVVDTELHKGAATGFDRVWVYVNEDTGHNTYFEDAGLRWHRWTYSINVEQGESHWVIIEQLPNDFMDAAKYGLKNATAPAGR